MQKLANVPELRFPEFSEEWQVKKLGQLIESIESGVSVNSEDRKKLKNETGILKTSAVSKGVFRPMEHKTILPAELVRSKLNPKKDSIIISRMNTPQLVGESGYVNRTYVDLYIPDRLWQITTTPETDTRWLSDLLASEKMRTILTSVSSGTSNSMKNISQPSFLSIKIKAPEKKEQQKIADLFVVINEKITTTEKSLRLIKKYKKYILKQIFTQQIKFKKNDGSEYAAWQTRSLGNIASIKTGRKDVNQGNPDGQYPFFTCAREHTHSDTYSFEGEAIMIAGNGEVGLCTYYNGRFEAYQRTYVLQDFSVSADYVFLYLNDIFQTFAESQKQQGSMPYIKLSTLQDFMVPIQDIEELNKITGLITSINDRIKNVEHKLKLAKKLKSSLLQKMFI